MIAAAPRIKLAKEEGRSALIDKEAETKLLEAAERPLKDVLTIMLDSGMRPSEVFATRWEDLTWNPGMIFIPRGKTPRSRRYPKDQAGVQFWYVTIHVTQQRREFQNGCKLLN